MTTITLKKTYASLPRTVRGKPIVINGDPKGKNFLYTNGNNVYIRNINDASECDIYSQHSRETTMAKYSPSGFYIASGDTAGKVRIWDTVNEEHILKIEHSVIGGAIKDLEWTMDNGKIVAVGEGRETFGRAFTYDSGNSTGDISGHTKSCNSVAVRQSRPMKVVTASEDMTSIFYEGPPFKFKCSKTDHTNFVNCVRYSPNGSVYVTGGADGKLFIYDGVTSELQGEIGAPKAHAGGIYAISFNKDGSKLLSCSGDKSAKIWNMETKAVDAEYKFGTQVTDMQVGCLWQDDNLLTVSLSGHINYLDSATAQPKKIVKGHNKPITSMVSSPDGSTFYTGASDGQIVAWDCASSESNEIKGKGHANQVSDMVLDGDYLISVSMDDTVRFTKTASGEYGESVKMDSQPQAVDSKNGVTVVACLNEVVVLEAPGRKLLSAPMAKSALSVSIRLGGAQVAVGSESHVHIFEMSGGELSEVRSLPAEDCRSVAYSPDGVNLAVTMKPGAVMMYDVDDNFKECVGAWGKQHTSRITDLSWSPDSRRFATGSIDSSIVVWEVGNFVGKKPQVKAHPLSHINKLSWLDNNSVLTVGQDSNVKVWSVSN